MTVTLTSIAPVLRIEDICELLKISRSQFDKLREQGWFGQRSLLVEVEPRIDRMPRYYGEPFAEWLSSHKRGHVDGTLRRALKDVSHG